MNTNNSQNDPNNKSFKVFVRVRPFNQMQMENANGLNYLKCEDKSIVLKNKGEEQAFTFYKIYKPQSKQEQIFQGVANDIIDNALIGINGTIFCYGQTSSGKTHTIVGDYEDNTGQQGLVPRVLNDLFQKKQSKINNLKASKIDIRIKISMVQIYNQKVKDLFDLNKNDLKIRQNKKQGVFIQNVTEKHMPNIKDGMSLIKQGIQNRTVGRTNMNAFSSRSHMLFIITITQTNFDTRQVKSAKVTLVDLAGSEKVSKTGCEGKMLLQAKKINTSLSTLAKVIFSLSQGKSNHIPYRDSKLTRILQQSIGGNSLTRLIINISPSQTNHPQIMTSLRFGASANMIKNCPKINKQYSIEQLTALLQKAELKIQRQAQIIKQYRKLFQEENIDEKKVSGFGFDQKSITMHMIPFDQDDQDDFDQQISLKSKSKGKSEFSYQNDIMCQTTRQRQRQQDQSVFFNNTGQFSLTSSNTSNKIQRKPNIVQPKSMKSIKLIEQEDNELQFEQKQLRKNTKSIKSVKIRQQLKKLSLKPKQLTGQNALADVTNKQNKKSNQQHKKSSIQIKSPDYINQIKTQIQQSFKQQLCEKLKNLLFFQIRLQLKEQIQFQINVQIVSLKGQIQSMRHQIMVNEQKLTDLTNKYQEANKKLDQHRQIIKEKDIKIKELKQKYQSKKQQINQQISKLKDFWENQVKF